MNNQTLEHRRDNCKSQILNSPVVVVLYERVSQDFCPIRCATGGILNKCHSGVERQRATAGYVLALPQFK